MNDYICHICNDECVDLITLSSHSKEKIKDIYNIKSINDNLKKSYEELYMSNKSTLEAAQNSNFKLLKLQDENKKLNMELLRKEIRSGELLRNISEKKEVYHTLREEHQNIQGTNLLLEKALMDLGHTSTYYQQALLAHRFKAAIKLFIAYPIIPQQLPAGSAKHHSQDFPDDALEKSAPAPMELQGFSTLCGIPFPNNGNIRGVPCEISWTVLTSAVQLVNRLAELFNMSLPYPMYAHQLPWKDACAAATKNSVFDVTVVSNMRNKYITNPYGIVLAAPVILVPNTDFDTNASHGSSTNSMNASIMSYQCVYLAPAIRPSVTSNEIAKDIDSEATKVRPIRPSNYRAPWVLPSILRNPECERLEDGWISTLKSPFHERVDDPEENHHPDGKPSCGDCGSSKDHPHSAGEGTDGFHIHSDFCRAFHYFQLNIIYVIQQLKVYDNALPVHVHEQKLSISTRGGIQTHTANTNAYANMNTTRKNHAIIYPKEAFLFNLYTIQKQCIGLAKQYSFALKYSLPDISTPIPSNNSN